MLDFCWWCDFGWGFTAGPVEGSGNCAVERCGPTLSYPRKTALDISKLGLFVSTAHAVQTKISRLTANSLHPPQDLGWCQSNFFGGIRYLFLFAYTVLVCFGFPFLFFFLISLFFSPYLVYFAASFHRLLFWVGGDFASLVAILDKILRTSYSFFFAISCLFCLLNF